MLHTSLQTVFFKHGTIKQTFEEFFCDLSKAFDSVNHKVFFQKLKFYGIQVKLLGWFESHLSGRKQRVVFNSHYTRNYFLSWEIVMCWILQGSVLGPLLSIIYVIDFPLNIRPISDAAHSGRFFMTLIYGYFLGICQQNTRFMKILPE
jgi:hypothetical protein